MTETGKHTNSHQEQLKARGVCVAADRMNWRATTYYDGSAGFAIPVRDAGGSRERFRALTVTSDGHKTKWLGKSGSYTPRLYHPANIDDAIKTAGGLVLIASGEFDLLTYVESGHDNVIAFTSENSIPRDLARTLKSWNVSTVRYWPDHDEAGRKSAATLRDRLAGTGIHYEAYSLADLVPEKGDTNDLWQSLRFDNELFWFALKTCPLLDLPEPDRSGGAPVIRFPSHKTGNEFPPDFVRDIIAVLMQQPHAKQRGPYIQCSSPLREDNKPSFSFNTEKLVWKDFGTGDAGGIVELGRRLGVEIRDYGSSPLPTGKETAVHVNDSANNTASPAPSSTGIAQAQMPQEAAGMGSALPFHPDLNAWFRYVSADLFSDHDTILLRSPLNTGKTHAIIQHIKATKPRRVLVLTHLQSLTRDIKRRFSAELPGEPFSLYSDLPAGQIRTGRVVCSLDSIYRLKYAEPFDLVVWDEIEQGVPHLWAGTMSGAAASVAYETLANVLKQAGQVIGLDAHASHNTAEFLTELRGDVWTIRNRYTHSWGDLTMHASESALIEAAARCATNNPDQPTVITTGSRKRARVYARMFRNIYGDEAVKVIHGWNSGSKSARAFLTDINEQLPRFRIFICSPSVGTGIDVQCEVAGVFAYFPGDHLSPQKMLQQMARYRNANQRATCVPHAEREGMITSAEALLRLERDKVRRTADLADFTQHGTRTVTATQHAITRLWASYTATSNLLKVDLRESFVSLAECEGFVVYFSEKGAEAMRQALKATREEQDDEDEQRIGGGEIEAVSPEDIDAKRLQGTLNEADFLGLLRWQIEEATGRIISPELYAQYHKQQARQGLRLFTAYLSDTESVKQLDRSDAESLPAKRHHTTAQRQLFTAALANAFPNKGLLTGEEDAIPAAVLLKRITAFAVDHLPDIRRYLDGRGDLSEKPVAVLRRLLGRFNVKLVSKQVRINPQDHPDGLLDARTMIYWIDQDALAVLREHAEFRLKKLKEKYGNRPSTNAETIYPIRERRQNTPANPLTTGSEGDPDDDPGGFSPGVPVS